MAREIQSGIVNKHQGGIMEVRFPKPFSNGVPTVVISPNWQNQGQQVTNIETIYSVTNTYFNIISGNCGDNYYVSWIAIGPDE